jgi:hypothetical protein
MATRHLHIMEASLSTAKEVTDMVTDMVTDKVMDMVMDTAEEAAMVSVTDMAGKAIKVSREDTLCQHGADRSAHLLELTKDYTALVEDCLNLDHPLASEEEVLDQEDPLDAGVDLVLESYTSPILLPFSLNTSVMVVSAEALVFKQLKQSLLFRTISNQYGECFSFCEV